MRPTKIISEPRLIKTNRGMSYEIECNDNKIYTLNELADIVSVTPACLSGRIRNFG